MRSFNLQEIQPHNLDFLNDEISSHGLLIENALIVGTQKAVRQSLMISSEGRICLEPPPEYSHETMIFNAKGLTIFPGAIDIHTHPRDGQQAHKETWQTMGRAAVAGGVTAAFGMPNTNPPTDTLATLRKRFELAAVSPINHSEYMGTLGENAEEILSEWVQRNASGIKEYLNKTTGHSLISPAQSVRLALKTPPGVNKLIHTLHAEGDTLSEVAEPLLKIGHHVHVAHISLASEVQFVREQQAKKRPITAEVAPHHLLMAVDEVRNKVRAELCELCTMKPPLSAQSDLPELFRGLKDGTILSIATDHAPHTTEEKRAALRKGETVYGLPGIQEMFPLMLAHLPSHDFSLSEISRLLSTNAASRFHIKSRGAIEYGNQADLAIFDLNKNHRIGDKTHPIHSRCGWSSYQDWGVKELAATIVNGRFAFANQIHSEQIHSRAIEFNR